MTLYAVENAAGQEASDSQYRKACKRVGADGNRIMKWKNDRDFCPINALGQVDSYALKSSGRERRQGR